MTILTVGLLGVATMFSTGYTDVTAAGKMTLGMVAARQMVEDMRALPFDRLSDLNNFDTDNATSLPPVDATLDPGRTMARNIARKWRYALAGEGSGFTFTTTEKSQWTILAADGVTFGARGQIAVVDQSPLARPNSLRLVTVTVTIPGRTANVQLSTLISRL